MAIHPIPQTSGIGIVRASVQCRSIIDGPRIPSNRRSLVNQHDHSGTALVVLQWRRLACHHDHPDPTTFHRSGRGVVAIFKRITGTCRGASNRDTPAGRTSSLADGLRAHVKPGLDHGTTRTGLHNDDNTPIPISVRTPRNYFPRFGGGPFASLEDSGCSFAFCAHCLRIPLCLALGCASHHRSKGTVTIEAFPSRTATVIFMPTFDESVRLGANRMPTASSSEHPPTTKALPNERTRWLITEVRSQ